MIRLLKMILLRFLLFFGVVVLGVQGCQDLALEDASAWYQDRDAVAPQGDRLIICHGFGCARRYGFTFMVSDYRRLKSILRQGKGSAAQERAALRKAVMWFERRVGPVVGSDKDVGGFDIGNANKAGQMDCIDETTNTTSLLLVLEKKGFLKHHKIGRPVARGFLLDGRYPHATATLIEKNSAKTYAIDPWPYGNGEDVDIMPLKIWMQKRPNIS